jgi:hypothetical protein
LIASITNQTTIGGTIIDTSIIHDTLAVIPAKAGIQQDKNAFLVKPSGFPLSRE